MIRHSYHGQRLLPALVETIRQHAYFSVEKYCWRLFNLASLNISEKVKFAKFAKYKGTLNIRDLQYIKDPTTYRHKYLPYGKDLVGAEFRKALTEVFSAQVRNSDHLKYLGSTQANESMNMAVSSKAPKRINYSGSKSLTSRVEAAVAQKNIGYTYVAAVSPWKLLA